MPWNAPPPPCPSDLSPPIPPPSHLCLFVYLFITKYFLVLQLPGHQRVLNTSHPMSTDLFGVSCQNHQTLDPPTSHTTHSLLPEALPGTAQNSSGGTSGSPLQSRQCETVSAHQRSATLSQPLGAVCVQLGAKLGQTCVGLFWSGLVGLFSVCVWPGKDRKREQKRVRCLVEIQPLPWQIVGGVVCHLHGGTRCLFSFHLKKS